MKKIISGLSAALLLFSMSFAVHAAPVCKKQSIEKLVENVAENYEAKTLGRLDSQKPYIGKIRIVIEHSLADDDDPQRFVVKRFSLLAKAEAWLKSREVDGMPGRLSRPVSKCSRGVCSYNLDGGIDHNHLYLKRITYGVRNACPYLKTIYILDGD